MNTIPLKAVAAAALLAALVMLAGCIVLSVYPFYNPKDLIADPSLAGSWVKTTATNESWQFTAEPDRSFLLTVSSREETNGLEAHVFQFEQYQYLDLLTTNRDKFQLPMHLLARVKHGDAGLSLNFLDYGWLTAYVATNPAALRYLVVPENAGDTNDSMLYLTATTRDLQVFLHKHAADTNAFSPDSLVELKRVAP